MTIPHESVWQLAPRLMILMDRLRSMGFADDPVLLLPPLAKDEPPYSQIAGIQVVRADIPAPILGIVIGVDPEQLMTKP